MEYFHSTLFVIVMNLYEKKEIVKLLTFFIELSKTVNSNQTFLYYERLDVKCKYNN